MSVNRIGQPNPEVTTRLAPDCARSGDFFIANIIDVSPKDDIASMEHPLFALKAGDTRKRTYTRNGNTITVMPGEFGCATIHDKDLWVYCISQMVQALNNGREITPTLQFTAYDFLTITNRGTSGRSYERLSDMLRRLTFTRVETNIETDGRRERGFFGLVDSSKVIEHDENGRMVAVRVTLPTWLFRSVVAKQVLTISPDYFRLRKPLYRRIYELARKHCGQQRSWRVSLTVLHQKSGSTAPLRNFRIEVRSLAESRSLPCYLMEFEADKDIVTFASIVPRGGLSKPSTCCVGEIR